MQKSDVRLFGSRSALLVALIGAPSVALAQSAPQPSGVAAPSEAATENGSADEIVVTARKRNESLQSVPVAVTGFSSEALRQKTIQRVYDLATNTPGLSIRSASGDRTRPDFFIRGQGSTYGSQPGVVAYLAEAPAFTPLYPGTNIQFYDLTSIQVLKGPQGTLFGRSTTGGAVLLAPQRPTNEFGGFVELSGGNYAYREATGALNIPVISDVLSLRVAGNIVRRDGFTRSITTGQRLDNRHQQSFRIGLLFKPADFIQNYTLFYGTDVDENSTGSAVLGYNPNLALFNTAPGGAARTTITGLCGAISGGNATTAQNCIDTRIARIETLKSAYVAELARRSAEGKSSARHIPTAYDDYVRGQVQTIYNETTLSPGAVPVLGELTIKNIFSTSRVMHGSSSRELGGVALPHLLTINAVDLIANMPVVTSRASNIHFLDNYTEEVQFGGTSGAVTWLLGYYREETDRPIQYPSVLRTFNNAFTVPLDQYGVIGNFTVDSRALNQGYFGQATVRVLDSLNVTGGYRISTARQTSYTANPTVTAAGIIAGAAVALPERKEKVDSYNVTVDYRPSRDLLVYVLTRKGYKAGGVNTPPTVAVPDAVVVYKPEILKDVETGAKYQWRSGSLSGRSNIAAYYQWYTGVQRNEALALPAPAVGIYTQINNIASARIYGLEFENSVQIGDRWNVTLNYSYTNAKYTKFPGTVTDIVGTVRQLIDSPFVGTPKHQGTLGVRYLAVESTSAGDISLSGELYLQSGVHLDDQEIIDPAHLGYQKGYANLNLRLDWKRALGSPVDASIFVRNVTDDVHLVGVSNFLSSLGNVTGVYNEPRTFGVQLRYRFGGDAN